MRKVVTKFQKLIKFTKGDEKMCEKSSLDGVCLFALLAGREGKKGALC
jgi:hypothetical protein